VATIYFILERNAVRIAFLEPRLCGIIVRNYLQVILVANQFAVVGFNPVVRSRLRSNFDFRRTA
jgi:hypothetical protein